MKNGWIRLVVLVLCTMLLCPAAHAEDGWRVAEGFSDTRPYCGWIWHSYLEPETFIPWE